LLSFSLILPLTAWPIAARRIGLSRRNPVWF
jgi:hypothetical protein